MYIDRGRVRDIINSPGAQTIKTELNTWTDEEVDRFMSIWWDWSNRAAILYQDIYAHVESIGGSISDCIVVLQDIESDLFSNILLRTFAKKYTQPKIVPDIPPGVPDDLAKKYPSVWRPKRR